MDNADLLLSWGLRPPDPYALNSRAAQNRHFPLPQARERRVVPAGDRSWSRSISSWIAARSRSYRRRRSVLTQSAAAATGASAWAARSRERALLRLDARGAGSASTSGGTSARLRPAGRRARPPAPRDRRIEPGDGRQAFDGRWTRPRAALLGRGTRPQGVRPRLGPPSALSRSLADLVADYSLRNPRLVGEPVGKLVPGGRVGNAAATLNIWFKKVRRLSGRLKSSLSAARSSRNSRYGRDPVSRST
jgi:hypothetical protein